MLGAVGEHERDRLGAHPDQLGAVAGRPLGRLRQHRRVVRARALCLRGAGAQFNRSDTYASTVV